jgi:hypothetical protein
LKDTKRRVRRVDERGNTAAAKLAGGKFPHFCRTVLIRLTIVRIKSGCK